jgi:hypothetical protein
MKTNIFQARSARFKATIRLNKKEVHQCDVFVYVEDVVLISLRRKISYKEYDGKTIKTDGRKLLRDALKFVGISRRDKVPNYLGIFLLGPD